MKQAIPWIFTCVVALCATPAFSQVVKLGTVAPEGSPWHEAMLEIREKWKDLSGGRVNLRIYAGGVAGDESDMVRKIRIGQLHAAALTSRTLRDIVPDIDVIALPMFIRTDDELDYIIEKIAPDLETRLAKKGLKVLTWSTTGWVHFFSKEPVITPEDMKKRKLFFWGSDTLYVELLKGWGFRPVPLAIIDLLPSLQTGLVDSFPAPPAAALAFQWFALAPNMMGLRWQPLPGATVISMKRWNRLPANLRPMLEDAARSVGTRLQRRIRKLEQEAVSAMKKHGLKVHEIPPAAEKQWGTLAREKAFPVVVGTRVSQKVFDSVRSLLDEYRSRGTKTVSGN